MSAGFPPLAFWIGSHHPFDLHEAYLNFEKRFVLEVSPQRAEALVTADSRYKLWINGQFVARGPARCWPHRQQYDRIEVTPLLRPGENHITAQVYSPGYSHFAYLHRGAHGLLFALMAGDQCLAASDTSWTVTRDPSWRADVPRISIYGGGIERRDLRCQLPAAQPARIVAALDSPLWSKPSERDVPLLQEDEIILDEPLVAKQATAAREDDPHQALCHMWKQGHEQESATRPAARGKALLLCYDLGVSRVCLARVRVFGARGGERLLVSYAESMQDGDIRLPDPSDYCRMRPTDEFILAKGEQVAETFSMRGGRYIIVALCGAPGTALRLQVSAIAPRYPLYEHHLNLKTLELQEIAALCARTTRACLQDGFVDSVWRESSQWLGDGVAQSFALAAISDDLRPLRRMIEMAAAGAYGDGVLPSVLPGECHAYTVTDYNFSWIELLQFYCTHPACPDADLTLSSMRQTMFKMLDHFAQQLDEDGLLRQEPGRRLFLDWSPVSRSQPSLTYNGRYLYALQIASGLAGDEELQLQAQNLASAMRRTFCRDGLWLENKSGDAASQLGLALLLLTDLMQPQDAKAACDAIIARSLDLDDSHRPGKLVLASPFMHHYVFLALEKAGEKAAIIEIIRARWGRWAKSGEVTCWENWNVNFPDGSKCHGFSAHPLGWLKRLG